jgi:hypothetical protein
MERQQEDAETLRSAYSDQRLIYSCNDRFQDRLKILFLSNRQSDVFEEIDIHNVVSPQFVILYEFS